MNYDLPVHLPSSFIIQHPSFIVLKPAVELHLHFAVEQPVAFVAQGKDAGHAQGRGVEHQELHADRAVKHTELVVGAVQRKRSLYARFSAVCAGRLLRFKSCRR